MPAEVVFHKAGEGRVIPCGALDAAVKVDSDQASGSSLIEIVLQPGFDAGLHVHDKLEETFYVLEGEVIFTAGAQEDQVVVGGPGSTLFIPPTIPHRVANRGAGPAKCILVWTPSSQIGSLDELATILSQGGPPDIAAIEELSARYDTHHISADAVRV